MSDEDEDAWDRVLFHLENQTGFWLGLVAGDDLRPRDVLREKARAFWEGEGGVFVLHEPELGKARALAVELTRQDEPALHWIRVDGEVGEEGAAELVLAMNERREAYRSRLDGGVVIEGRASLKRMVRELAPDLFSIRAFVVEPEGVPVMPTIERPEWALRLRSQTQGETLSEPDLDLDRASRLAGIDGHGAMMARFDALTRAVEALIGVERVAEAGLWAGELVRLTERWGPENSLHQERRRALSFAKALEVRSVLRFLKDGKGEEELVEAIALYESCDDHLGRADCLAQRGWLFMAQGSLAESEKDLDVAMAIYETREDVSGQSFVLRVRGKLELRRNNLAFARKFYERAIQLRRSSVTRFNLDALLAEYAQICVMQGDKMAAEQLAAEILRISGRSKNAESVATAILAEMLESD